MKIDKYTQFINEMVGKSHLDIHGYTIHEDDIEDIFSSLYKNIPLLSKSEVYMLDITEDKHPNIRKFHKIPETKSQFRIDFFIKEIYTKGTDWWDRFYQPHNKVSVKLITEDICKDINDKMESRFGYKLIKTSKGNYDDRLSDGKYIGYILSFYFSIK